jgi:hypothetical protein
VELTLRSRPASRRVRISFFSTAHGNKARAWLVGYQPLIVPA